MSAGADEPPSLPELGKMLTQIADYLTRHQSTPDLDQLLTAEEAAQFFGVTKHWLYRRAKEVPFSVRLGPKTLRFSRRGLQAYIESLRGEM